MSTSRTPRVLILGLARRPRLLPSIPIQTPSPYTIPFRHSQYASPAAPFQQNFVATMRKEQLEQHAASHSKKTMADCFPNYEKDLAAAILAATTNPAGRTKGKKVVKAEKKGKGEAASGGGGGFMDFGGGGDKPKKKKAAKKP